MKTIYDFSAHMPPELSAARLRALHEERRLRRQTRVLFLSAAACQGLLLLLGCLLMGRHPLLAILCMGYGLLACAGSIALTALSVRKEVR